MAHHIYQTECYVCGGKNIGEANRLLFLFTKDLGMIVATAQGIRLLKSKLRYSLQELSYAGVSLIKGKNSWKVTNAHQIFSADFLEDDKNKYRLRVRIFSLLRRLLTGEEKNEKLFALLHSGLEHLSEINSADIQAIKNFECLLVLRILHNLGYCGDTEPLKQFVAGDISYEWNSDLLEKISLYRPQALSTINSSLSETQL